MDIIEYLNEKNYSVEFNYAVIKELENIPDIIPDNEINSRENLFDETIITIDGEDAKDLDDAVSLKKLKNGNYLLGVHIADVSHYVKEGTAIDDEAFIRGTSVYLADTVVPMLPKKLSNGLCSLLPHKPRLALSCIMEILPNGGVINYEIKKTVIKTKYRMDYNTVYKILDGDMSGREKYAEIVPLLELMRELALVLWDKRCRRGSIDFNFPEAKVVTDENGKVTDIVKYKITIANKIIEEFMLVANETVAKHLLNNDLPGVFRIHEEPESEKITRLAGVVKPLGYKFKLKESVSPKAMQNLLFEITGTDAELAISTIMLRSMMKARYCEENLGHFGLAAQHYCHFTSPIRRYPDLFVHRILSMELKGELTDEIKSAMFVNAKRAALQSSETEADAVIAERDYVDYKACEFMSDKIGQKFSGVISSTTSFGFFVQMDNTVEGLVRMVDLDDDYYEFDENNFVLFGKRSGKVYKIGDRIDVILSKVNTELKQIDFVPYKEKQIKKRGEKTNGTRRKHSKKSKHKGRRSK